MNCREVFILDPAGEKEGDATHAYIYRLGWVTQLYLGGEERHEDLPVGFLCKLQ